MGGVGKRKNETKNEASARGWSAGSEEHWSFVSVPTKVWARYRCMVRSQMYRRFARACLEMAGAVTDHRIRDTLTHMAQVWFRLAEDRADLADKKQSDES
jgi:hypothetical protein